MGGKRAVEKEGVLRRVGMRQSDGGSVGSKDVIYMYRVVRKQVNPGREDAGKQMGGVLALPPSVALLSLTRLGLLCCP